MSTMFGKEMSKEKREDFYKKVSTKTINIPDRTPVGVIQGDEWLKGLSKEEVQMFVSIIQRQYFDRNIRIKIDYAELNHKTAELENFMI